MAQYVIEKLIQLGAKPVTCSDSGGFIHDAAGIDADKLAFIKELKNVRRGRIREYVSKYPSATFTEFDPGALCSPQWDIQADVAFPSATQNEICGEDAGNLVANGAKCVIEAANMPITPEAIQVLHDSGVLHAPGKAANAGGVATSGLEMSQNSLRLSWTREEVDSRLEAIMKSIHASCIQAAEAYGSPGNYLVGANIAAFLKVARAMMDQGVV